MQNKLLNIVTDLNSTLTASILPLTLSFTDCVKCNFFAPRLQPGDVMSKMDLALAVNIQKIKG